MERIDPGLQAMIRVRPGVYSELYTGSLYRFSEIGDTSSFGPLEFGPSPFDSLDTSTDGWSMEFESSDFRRLKEVMTSPAFLHQPRSLHLSACEAKYPDGNLLLHEFVLKNCGKPRNPSYIQYVLRSFPRDSEVNSRRNARGFTALQLAVMKQDPFMVESLLSCLPSVDVDAISYKGNIETALHLAIAHSDTAAVYADCLEIVKILIKHGAALDISDQFGHTPLFRALKHRRYDVLKLLVSKGANVNASNNGIFRQSVSPLHEAVKIGDLESVKYLVENGAFLEAAGNDGRTALHEAAKMGNLEAVKCLVENGAFLNAVDRHDRTALHEAAKAGNFEAVKCLVEKGAYLKDVDKYGRTALHETVMAGNFEAVEFLLQKGVAIDAADCYGDTALHQAAMLGQAKILELLISKGGSLSLIGHRGLTPLEMVIMQAPLDAVKALFERGVPVDVPSAHWVTPLHFAAINNRIELLQLLISRGADLDARDGFGNTPLHNAALEGNMESVKVLIKSGADLDAKNVYGVTAEGITALIFTRGPNHVEIGQYLKSRRANANAGKLGPGSENE